jgi:hypothetical protein
MLAGGEGRAACALRGSSFADRVAIVSNGVPHATAAGTSVNVVRSERIAKEGDCP